MNRRGLLDLEGLYEMDSGLEFLALGLLRM